MTYVREAERFKKKLLTACVVFTLVAILAGAAGCTSLNSNSNPSKASGDKS